MFNSIRQWILTLNLFAQAAEQKQSDSSDARLQRFSTRLYLILLTGAVLVLLVSTSLSTESVSRTAFEPSEDEYNDLFGAHPETLSCSCSQLTTVYGDFVSVTATFHQVCSSSFISQSFIDAVFDPNASYYHPLDIRATLSAQMQLLRSFCDRSQSAIADALVDLLNDTYLITPRLITPLVLNAQTNAEIAVRQDSARAAFVRQLALIRQMSLSNQLMSGLNTNYRVLLYPDDGSSVGFFAALPPCVFENQQGVMCACQNSFSCGETAGFYSLDYNLQNMGIFTRNESRVELVIPGLLAGCIPLESLLASSLKCFYNATCITQLSPSESLLGELDATKISRYAINSTVEALLEQLMIEQWIVNVSFTAYFAQCNPTWCNYTTASRVSPLYVVTNLLGLYGGLTVFLRLIVPHIIIILFVRLSNRHNAADHLSFADRIRNFFMTFINLNLFSTTDHTVETVKKQRWVTRLYMILLTSLMTVLLLYTSLSYEVAQQTIISPTQSRYEHLVREFGNSVSCPCSQIAVLQGRFISMKSSINQVCNSSFVSPMWLDLLGDAYSFDLYYTDFRLIGLPNFQLLSQFCLLAKQTVIDALFLFENTKFFSAQVLTETDLRSQSTSLGVIFVTSTTHSFANDLDLIRATIQGNQVLTATYANFGLPIRNSTTNGTILDADIVPGLFTHADRSVCFCARDSACAVPMAIHNISFNPFRHHAIFDIPSFYFGCLLVDSFLESTLECFFDNSDCLENILPYLTNDTSSVKISRLVSTQSSKYRSNTTMGVLVENLFVEEWSTDISYASYFAECAPDSCTYTYMKRKSALYVVVTLLGLYGGLSVVLRLTIPFFFGLIAKHINKHRFRRTAAISTISVRDVDEPRPISFLSRLRSVTQWLIGHIWKLNLFAMHGNVVKGRQITRAYMVVLTTAVLILIIRTGLVNSSTLSETIQSPSAINFESLLSKHADLLCPCSQLTVPYSTFVSINVSYHQICSSDFISSRWLDRTMGKAGFDNVSILYPNTADFRRQAVVHFALIGVFCQLAKDTINDAIAEFSINQLATTRPLVFAAFNKQVQSIVDQFRTFVPNSFIRKLTLVRQTTQGNGWLTLYTSNWRYVVRETLPFSTVFTAPIMYDNCSCATNATCSQPAGVYNNQTYVELPGFHIGCYPLEALLQSSLICLFNSACVKLLEFYFPPSNESDVMRSLLEDGYTQYKTNTTIEMLVNQLLVEQWMTSISYGAYFAQCAPKSCTYTYTRKNSPLVIITTILGLSGGLTIVLRILIPLVFYFFWHIFAKFNTVGHAVSSTS